MKFIQRELRPAARSSTSAGAAQGRGTPSFRPRNKPDLPNRPAGHHLVQPWDMLGTQAPIERSRLVLAEGVYIYDDQGKKLLVGPGVMWCVQFGYGRREIADAVHRQLLQLPFYNTFFQTTHPAAAELSRLLAEVTPDGLNHVFFTNSGS